MDTVGIVQYPSGYTEQLRELLALPTLHEIDPLR